MIRRAISAAAKTALKFSRSFVLLRLKMTASARMTCGPIPFGECEKFFWSPFDIFLKRKETPVALLILNRPIASWETFACLWEKAILKVSVDGGTNQCFQLSAKMNLENKYIPDIICGDLDSALPHIVDFYMKKGVKIISTPEQDATDFTKALRIAVSTLNKNKVVAMVALVEMSGRVDHIFGVINTMFLSRELVGSTPVFIVSHDSITWLLEPGYHSISLPDEVRETWCGLVPIGKPCQNVTTTGLKWNLRNQSLQFGGIVSTSNTFSDSNVTIHTDGLLLFTMGIPKMFVEENHTNT